MADLNALCRVIATKPKGLTLIQLACGCCEWSRRRPDGQIHHGHRAAWCGHVNGEGPKECVATHLDPVGMRFSRAAEFVHSKRGQALIAELVEADARRAV